MAEFHISHSHFTPETKAHKLKQTQRPSPLLQKPSFQGNHSINYGTYTLHIPNYTFERPKLLLGTGGHMAIAHGTRCSDNIPVLAKLSPYTLRLEREYYISRRLYTQPDGDQYLHNVIEMVPLSNDGLTALIYTAQPSYQTPFSTAFVDISTFLTFAIGACASLHFLHVNNIIHGELRPSAFQWHKEDVKIWNFGTGLKSYEDILLTGSGWRRAAVAAAQEDVAETCLFARLGSKSFQHTLAYASPEQTGRTSNVVDHRTDLYSLGISLFVLLTGQMPFEGSAMDVIHAALSRNVPPVHTIRKDVPPMISLMIDRLTRKAVDERYNSIYGFREDLLEFKRQMKDRATDKQESLLFFPLALHDIYSTFQFPNQLLGRDKEINLIRSITRRVSNLHATEAEKRAASMGQKEAMGLSTESTRDKSGGEVVVIMGPGGVGKSVLVTMMHTQARQFGYLASSKFDANQKRPYNGLLLCLSSILRQMLTESEAVVRDFYTDLKEQLGPQFCNVWLIVDRVPELKPIFNGKKYDKPHEDMLGGNSESRFHAVFLSIIRTISIKKMVTMCLDDLQEADEPSLHLISTLISSRITLLMILTCRDNDHLPQSILDILQCPVDDSQRTYIHLQPLSLESLNQLVCQTLHRTPEDTLPLTEMILRRTRGNPFFAKQFMTMMKRREDIWLNWDEKQWQFRLDHDAQAFYPPPSMDEEDSAVSIRHLVSHLKDLDPCAQKLLMWASLIGNVFDFRQVQWFLMADSFQKHNNGNAIETWDEIISSANSGGEGEKITQEILSPSLGMTSQQEDPRSGQAMTGLQVCLQENIIYPKAGSEFQFVHDRYYQAATLLVNDHDAAHMHFQISQILLTDPCADVFLTANHVVKSIDWVRRSTHREKYRQIVKKAGDESYVSGAYQTANMYYEATHTLLSDTPWTMGLDESYKETLDLYKKLTELSWRNSQKAQTEHWLHKIIQKTRDNPIDCAYAWRFQARMYFEKQQHDKGIDVIVQALRSLNVEGIESTVSELQVLTLYKKVRHSIDTLDDQLLHIGPCTNPRTLAVMSLLYEACTGAYWICPRLIDYMALQLVQISLEEGYGMASGGGLILVGCASVRLKEVKFGAYLGKLGTIVSEKYANNAEIARDIISYQVVLAQWTGSSFSDILSQLQRAYVFAVADGDKMYSALALFHISTALLYTGFNLSEIKYHIHRSIEECQSDNSGDAYILNTSLSRIILALQGKTTIADPEYTLDDPTEAMGQFREKLFIEDIYKRSVNPYSHLNWHWCFKIVILFHFGHFDKAAAIGFKILDTIFNHRGHRHIGIAIFYHCMSMIACVRDGGMEKGERQKYLEQIEKNKAMLDLWADQSEVNYRMYRDILKAEYSTIDNDMEHTVQLFDKAIEIGLKNRWYSFLGLAYQLSAEYYIRKNIKMLALPLLNQSLNFYDRWGAHGKTQYLTKRYKSIIQRIEIMTRKVEASVQTDEPDICGLGTGFWQEEEFSPDPSLRELYGDEISSCLSSNESTLFSLDIVDLASIIKSSQVIANEMNSFDELLKKMMGIIMANSGAEVGAIIVKEGDFGIAAHSTRTNGCSTLDPPTRLNDGANLISPLVVHYAIHTQSTLFIPNMQEDTRFATGMWNTRTESVSVICMPILHKNTLVGVLYLEANLSTFTRKHVTVLSLLCDQIGTSITNALLFKSIQKATMANALMIQSQQQALEEARNSREQALKATELKSNFLANMSHELRTPFSGFYGMISLLSETQLDPEQREFVSIAKQSCEMLLQIIDDLLDFSKLEARKVKIQYGLFYMEDLIGDRIELLITLASNKNLELTYFIGEEVPLMVYADGNRIGQILMNLIGNAIKFTHVGEVIVRCDIEKDLSKISSPLNDDEIILKFCVQDTGIGMTKEETKCLFLPFSQVDGSTTRNFGGTGLGLSICLELVGLMSGDIWVESTENIGSTFVFRVRVMKSESVAEAGIDKNPKETEIKAIVKQLGQPRLLLVTSNRMCKMIKTLLPFYVQQAESPSHALEIARTSVGESKKSTFDCIIIDMAPPDVIKDMIERMESTKELKHLPIILLYAHTVNNIKHHIEGIAALQNRLAYPIFHSRITRISKPIRKLKLLNALIVSSEFHLQPNEKANTCSNLCSLTTTDSELNGLNGLNGLSGLKDKLCIQVEPSYSYANQTRGSFIPEELAIFRYQKILVAEDNPVAQKLIVKQLVRIGFTVETCNNGFECIDKWKLRGPGYFSLAWIDHHMPGCDGLEATQKIRKMEAAMKVEHTLPIIALTADIQKTAQQNCLEAGMNDYITKPLMQKDLVAVLRRYCFNSKSTSTSTLPLSPLSLSNLS